MDLGVLVPEHPMPGSASCGFVKRAGGVGGSLVGRIEPRGGSVGVLCCSGILQPKRSGVFVRHRILRGECALCVIQLAGSGVLLRHRLRLGLGPSVSPCGRSVGPGGRAWFGGSFCISLCGLGGGARLLCWFAAILIQESPSVVLEWVRFRPVKICGLR